MLVTGGCGRWKSLGYSAQSEGCKYNENKVEIGGEMGIGRKFKE